MKVQVAVTDPEQILGEELRIDWTGTYLIEVADDLSRAEAEQVAVAACKEQLGIPPCAPVAVCALAGFGSGRTPS